MFRFLEQPGIDLIKKISQEFSLRILRQYNRPSNDEVAVLIIGGTNSEENHCVIILCTNEGVLKRISEVHPSYMALQYPLLFFVWRRWLENGYIVGRQ